MWEKGKGIQGKHVVYPVTIEIVRFERNSILTVANSVGFLIVVRS